MLEPQFPDYAIKISQHAQGIRRSLPAHLRPLVDTIESKLADDPKKYPDRIVPLSVGGSTSVFLYIHPDPEIQITFQVDEDRKVLYFSHYSVPAFSVKKTVFISYSHADRVWLEKLRSFLSVLEQQGVIGFWDDSKLEPGVPWEDQIREVLQSAKAGLLLISQPFLTSKFITGTELPQLLADAESQGKKIFWLQVSASTVFETHQEITRFQSLLENPQISLEELEGPQQRRALVQISKKLAEAIASH